MNILIIVDKLTVDGRSPTCIALNFRDAASRFRDRGCEVTVCNLRTNDPGAALLRDAGISVVETGCSSASPRTYPAVLRIAGESGADLIHAHGYAAANFGRLAGRRLKLPVVIHEHALLRVRPHQYVVDKLLRNFTTRGVAISGAVAQFMASGRSVPPERIVTIPNGIDLSRFQAASRLPVSEARAGMGLPADQLVIGSAARFREEKGLNILFDAATRLLKRFPEMKCVMAGDGSDRAAMMEQAHAAGLSDKILFPGFVDDIPLFMRSLSVLVIPSLQEGLSYSAMEAMASGTPVVASRVGGLPELIDDSKTGILVPPGDANALAGAIEKLLTDEALRKNLVEQAKCEVTAYDLDNYADRMVELYQQLLSTECDQ